MDAKILKFHIMTIHDTSTPTQIALIRIKLIKIALARITLIWIVPTLITPNRITPTRITPIWFLPTCQTLNQTMISLTLVIYNKWCNGIQRTDRTLIFLWEHLYHIVTYYGYIHTLHSIHATHQYLTLEQQCLFLDVSEST